MKQRLDLLMIERNMAPSREKAKALIMAGVVFVNGQREDKAGTMIADTADIIVKDNTLKYVSRGGLKLEKSIEVFNVDVKGKICMDVGSSTGGFTDCMLQNGAVKVYAIDVGRGQLDWKLRNDERVISMEKTNIRYVTPDQLADVPEFSSIDVSFISLSKVLPVVHTLLSDDGKVVALIKPQFEAGREQVGKKGIVREPKIHLEVINKVIEFSLDIGFYCIDLTFSPVRGMEGNIEYLIYLRKAKEDDVISLDEVLERIDTKALVELSHASLVKEAKQ